MLEVSRRTAAIAQGAAEWRDPASQVRAEARGALRGSPWSAPVVEVVLDHVLRDLDEVSVEEFPSRGEFDDRPVLVVLPGNVIGPAIASAYCAAVAGSRAILKSADVERKLADIVVRQFERLGPPLAGALQSRYWKGGDDFEEAGLFGSIGGIVAFGTDKTIADLRRRCGGLTLIGHGERHSVGVIGRSADFESAAREAATDICIFDQTGCMSPQTIYVEGDEGRALMFAHALARALERTGSALPAVAPTRDEAAAVAAFARRLAVTAVEPRTHGLDTLILGPRIEGCPTFVVAVEPPGPPTCAGFGRIVVVKALEDAAALRVAFETYDGELDTAGIAGSVSDAVRAVLDDRFTRVCPVGEMQRPPFGYRPSVQDFLTARE